MCERFILVRVAINHILHSSPMLTQAVVDLLGTPERRLPGCYGDSSTVICRMPIVGVEASCIPVAISQSDHDDISDASLYRAELLKIPLFAQSIFRDSGSLLDRSP